MNDCWQNIIVGMKVEVENRDTDHSGVFSNSFWVASVLRISGYYAHLRYEGTHTCHTGLDRNNVPKKCEGKGSNGFHIR